MPKKSWSSLLKLLIINNINNNILKNKPKINQ